MRGRHLLSVFPPVLPVPHCQKGQQSHAYAYEPCPHCYDKTAAYPVPEISLPAFILNLRRGYMACFLSREKPKPKAVFTNN